MKSLKTDPILMKNLAATIQELQNENKALKDFLSFLERPNITPKKFLEMHGIEDSRIKRAFGSKRLSSLLKEYLEAVKGNV